MNEPHQPKRDEGWGPAEIIGAALTIVAVLVVLAGTCGLAVRTFVWATGLP